MGIITIEETGFNEIKYLQQKYKSVLYAREGEIGGIDWSIRVRCYVPSLE